MALGATTPLFVLWGEATPTVVSGIAILAYATAALLWARHTLRLGVPWWTRIPSAVLALGLLIAASGFFFAIGAAVATVAAAGHGAVLLSHRPALRQRRVGAMLALTAVGVPAVAAVGDLTTEGGFAATAVVFAGTLGAATASLGAGPRPPRGSDGDATPDAAAPTDG